jgi:hypothetical protein
MSTSFFSHSVGSIAATVRRPRGGKPDFFDMMPNICRKLQKLSGHFGYTRRILKIALLGRPRVGSVCAIDIGALR